MGWIAGVGAAVGGLASAYGSMQGSKQKSLAPSFYNAYGEANAPATGAITSRNNIFDVLNSGGLTGQASDASQSYANALRAAAGSPALSAANRYVGNEIAGNFLQSPEISNYANQAYNSIISQGANQNARTRANFANNGVGFSTGMQQAEQANNAAASNQAAQARAGILAQGYQGERQLQQGAVGLQESLTQQPLNYLSAVNSALFAPLSSQAGLTTGLLGSPVYSPQPTYVQQPNLGNAIGSGAQTASGLYSLFSSMGGGSGGY